jgi:antitoxin (DNA-binding transcriptional repressor) of toxin-antitoxin stability system
MQQRIGADRLEATDQGRNTMMSTVTIEEAQANLPEIIDKLAPGEELIIMRNNQPIAKLVGQQHPARKPRQPGSAKGKLIILAEDDEHLKDFKEYML